MQSKKIEKGTNEYFHKLIDQLAEGHKKHDNFHYNTVQDIIKKSRLLYSNTTQQLFDMGESLNLEEPENKNSGDKAKNCYEQLKKDFLNEYNQFLV